MRIGKIIAGAVLAAALAGCQTLQQRNMSVAEYCADPDRAGERVCQLKIELDGQSTSLASTNMSLSEARKIADEAKSLAGAAYSAANNAQSTADQAMSRANAALLSEKDLVCETRTIRQTKVGTCQPGYTLMSCTQTHYTTRSGGPSIMREINDQQCRDHDQVLELQARCCKASATTTTTTSTPASY